MKWYLNPGRWICTNVKLHDSVAAQKKIGGVSRNIKRGHHSKRKKKK
jgi:hypothetical protein